MQSKTRKTIKELPEDERPREKLLKYGADKLNDTELLAILLRTGTKGRSAIDMAEEIRMVVVFFFLALFGGIFFLIDARSHWVSDTLAEFWPWLIVALLSFDIITRVKGQYPFWWKPRLTQLSAVRPKTEERTERIY